LIHDITTNLTPECYKFVHSPTYCGLTALRSVNHISTMLSCICAFDYLSYHWI